MNRTKVVGAAAFVLVLGAGTLVLNNNRNGDDVAELVVADSDGVDEQTAPASTLPTTTGADTTTAATSRDLGESPDADEDATPSTTSAQDPPDTQAASTTTARATTTTTDKTDSGAAESASQGSSDTTAAPPDTAPTTTTAATPTTATPTTVTTSTTAAPATTTTSATTTSTTSATTTATTRPTTTTQAPTTTTIAEATYIYCMDGVDPTGIYYRTTDPECEVGDYRATKTAYDDWIRQREQDVTTTTAPPTSWCWEQHSTVWPDFPPFISMETWEDCTSNGENVHAVWGLNPHTQGWCETEGVWQERERWGCFGRFSLTDPNS
ncbi:MAG: hypothetical protein R2770_14990 [Acidimicrobiales bacterium]